MTLNGVMAVALRYFTDFGKPALQQPRRSVVEFMYNTSLLYFVVRVCTMSSVPANGGHF